MAGYQQKGRFDPWPELEVLQHYGLGPESLLVDIGCGTGDLLLAAAACCNEAVGVDVSRPMLDFVAHQAQALNITNLKLLHAGFLSFVLDQPADFVYSRNALHHLPDFWKLQALKHTAQQMRTGSILRLTDLVYSFEPQEAESYLQAWLDKAPLDPKEGWSRDELQTHIAEEYSSYAWAVESMLERTGFEVIEAAYSPSRIFAAYVCKRR